MRQFATFVSFLAVAWATAAALKHSLPWPHSAYLIAQSLFALCGWWIAQRVSVTSREYLFFFGTFGLVLLFAIWVALYYPIHRGISLLLIPSLAVALFFCGLRIYEVLGRKAPVPSHITLSLVNGGVLLFCGIMALLSLVEPLSPDLVKATTSLGFFWFLQGLFGWMHAATRGRLQLLNEFAPQFIAIVCFAGLAVWLSGAQPESARQHSSDELVLSEMHILETQ